MPRTLSQKDIDDFRERLCDAAEHLFAERGAEGVTIRELAAAVGVSPMTPYRYFKDKDAILAAVRARAFDRHAETLEAAYADESTKTAERAGALSRAYVRFAEENPEAYKLMFDVRQPSAGDYPDLVRASARSYRTMTLQLSDEIAAGRLSGDPEEIGRMYWAALHGPLMLQMSGLLDRNSTQALIHNLLTTLDKALWGEARKGF
ncbi:MAG: TetR/AcrR family transcriptional regulator [Caulobacteraceae bacterium]|nr:TetR/AcrR family transcriptional regulator [Caulobacteraceae bacterium]